MTQGEPVPPIGTQISQLAQLAPDEPAVTCDGLTLTRAELDRSTNRLARAYAERGVGVGDYVTMVLPNSIEWIQAAVACWKLGAVPQPLSARLPDAELHGLLDLRPPALLVGPRDTPKCPACRPVSRPTRRCLTPRCRKRFRRCGRRWGRAAAPGGPSSSSPAATAGYRLPSAIHSARRRATPRWCRSRCPTTPASPPRRSRLLMRHHLVLMSRFDPHRFLRLITDHRVTFLTTVPTIMQRALPVYHADPKAYDLSSIRRFWHMGAPCPPAIKQAWIELLGPEEVWELYGGTELQALTFISGDQWLTHRGSVGAVVAGEMKVLDDDGNPCPPGMVGEIYMRPEPRQRADLPLHRRHGQDPRRLGLAGRPRLLRRRRVPLPVGPPGRHVHRRRPQRLPRRDRERALGAPRRDVLPRRRRPRPELRGPGPGAVRPGARGRRVDAGRRKRERRFCANTSRDTRCRTPSNSSRLPCVTTPARRGDRRWRAEHRADGAIASASASMTWLFRPARGVSPSGATPRGTATRPARS